MASHPTTDVDSRLCVAAEGGDTIEVILVVRGKVRRSTRPSRWRMRLDGGGVMTFAADSVVAATPVRRPPRR
jgi:hypothetical protein